MNIAAVRSFALSLPEVTEEPHHDFGSFRMRGKIFVTLPPGDAFIHVFVPEVVREQALAVHDAFVEKLLWGGKVMGLRVRLAGAEPSAVTHLVREAWIGKAPKRLAASLATFAGQASTNAGPQEEPAGAPARKTRARVS